MREEIEEAVESARSVGLKRQSMFAPTRMHSREMILAIFKSLCRDLPEDASVRELRDVAETL